MSTTVVFRNLLTSRQVLRKCFEATIRNTGSLSSFDQMFKDYPLNCPKCPGDVKPSKITVMGCGQVGTACILSLMTDNITCDLALIDRSENQLTGDLIDLQHASCFNKGPNIYGSTDLEVSKDSDIVIITAGVRQEPNQSRLALLEANHKFYQELIPKLCDLSPNGILIIITNPCDIMTYCAHRFSKFPKNRIIGSGTNLDSGRFSHHGAANYGLPGYTMSSMVLGEHGESAVTPFSVPNFYGNRVKVFNNKMGECGDPDNWNQVKKTTIDAAGTIILKKGFTNMGVAFSVLQICRAIMHDTRDILLVSTCAEQIINRPVFMGLPSVIGRDGVLEIAHLKLSEAEMEAVLKSADVLEHHQSTLKF